MPLGSAELAAYRAAMEETLTDTLDIVRAAAPGFVNLVPGAPSETTAHAGVPCSVRASAEGKEVPIAGGSKILVTATVKVAVGTDVNPATDVFVWHGRRLAIAMLNDRTNALLDSYTCGEVR